MQVMWEQGWSATPLSQRPHIPVVGRVAVSLIFAQVCSSSSSMDCFARSPEKQLPARHLEGSFGCLAPLLRLLLLLCRVSNPLLPFALAPRATPPCVCGRLDAALRAIGENACLGSEHFTHLPLEFQSAVPSALRRLLRKLRGLSEGRPH